MTTRALLKLQPLTLLAAGLIACSPSPDSKPEVGHEFGEARLVDGAADDADVAALDATVPDAIVQVDAAEDDRQNPWERDPDPYDLDFPIPRTERFAPTLSAYGLYQEPMARLRPAAGALQYELTAELFTDHAKKHRLVRVPAGRRVTRADDGRLVFPEGSVLAKTFYYPADMRSPTADLRIIETRLLVKTDGSWNVATYLWNAAQTDATLLLDGVQTEISWLDDAGHRIGTEYVVPHEGECVTCHQRDGASVFIGPTLRGLNRDVVRDGATVNQIVHLQAGDVLADGDWSSAPSMPDYRDETVPLAQRARSYLDINCAHCHRPGSWDDAGDRRVDFRYSTPLAQTGLARKARDLARELNNGDMPYLGTTLIDADGVQLVLDYVESL